jgi:hypothetical protein
LQGAQVSDGVVAASALAGTVVAAMQKTKVRENPNDIFKFLHIWRSSQRVRAHDDASKGVVEADERGLAQAARFAQSALQVSLELPLLRLERRVLLPGVKISLPITAKISPVIDKTWASEERRLVSVLAYPDGFAPIATSCRLVQRDRELDGERAWLIAESRVRILFARGDEANVEPFEDQKHEVSPEQLDRARSVLIAKATESLHVPGEIIELVATSENPELIANLVLTFTYASPGKMQRALELDDAAARIALCLT